MTQHKLLVGYIPLFDPRQAMDKPGQTFEINEWEGIANLIQKSVDEDRTLVYGVAWVSNPDQTTTPVFIMEDAKAVCDHLRLWCEEDFSRFYIKAVQKEEGYAIALIPDKDQSISRWKTARLAFHDEIVEDSDFTVLYQILGVFCANDRLGQIKDNIPPRTMLGFVNKDKCQDLSWDLESATFLGPFEFRLGEDDHLTWLFPNSKEVKENEV